MLDVSVYELVWPTALFTAEAERISRSDHRQWVERARLLLGEAFAGTTAVGDFDEVGESSTIWADDDPWSPKPPAGQAPPAYTQRTWLRELIDRAAELRHARRPRPYWPQRHGAPSDHARHKGGERREFARLVEELDTNGYLVEVFGRDCVDDPDPLPDRSRILDRHLGHANLWPLDPDAWDDDVFFGLIEVFHDLVSRPRNRDMHSYSGCGWHHKEFNAAPGRALYRWRINNLLHDAGIDYRLADEGEDLGRLVALTDDARGDLVHRVLNTPDPRTRASTEHAIALFRARGATRDHKRSAIVALARILEQRRDLIKTEAGKPDDGFLFEIANRYDLRHGRADQRADYDDAFLDWIFWWYLATVELTDRILNKQRTPHDASEFPDRLDQWHGDARAP
ncbi:hypothetical protein [Embleya sp. MST-111070]|uniref:hypothetical protein n=1 Tax=Embleya sp. MST-111070 TaxID=3398231 RepID=UPI003F73A18A